MSPPEQQTDAPESGLSEIIEALRESNEMLSVQNAVAQVTTGTPSAAAMCDRLVEVVRGSMPCDAFYLDLYDEQAQTLRPVRNYDIVADVLQPVQPESPLTSLRDPLKQHVIDERRPLLINRTDPDSESPAEQRFGDKSRPSASLLYVPLISGNRVIGIMSAQSYQRHAYSGHHAALLEGVARQTGPALEAALLTESLRTNEERMRLFVEHTPAAIAMFDREMHYLLASRRWMTDYGLTESVIGRSHYEVFPEIPERWRRIHQLGLAGEVMKQEEDHFIRQDGRVEWLRWENRPWRDANGEIGGIIIFSEVITDRKNTEQARALLATAVDQAAEAIIITDTERLVRYVNPAFERMTEYAEQDVKGSPFGVLESGDHPADSVTRMWSAVESGATWVGALTVRRRDGTPVASEVVVSPVRESSGRVGNYVAIVRDVSQENALQEQLHQAQKMEAIGQLAGGIAHDFNNLLTAIMGNIALARTESNIDEVHDLMAEAEHASGRAAALVKQLLTFSRKTPGKRQVVDLAPIIEEVAAMVRNTFDKKIRVEVDKPLRLRRVLADGGQIHQVLLNLCLNARDALEQRGKAEPSLPLQLRIAAQNVEVMATVRLVLRRRGRESTCGCRCETTGPAWTSTRAATCSSRSSQPSRWGRAPVWGWPRRTASSSSIRDGLRSRARPGPGDIHDPPARGGRSE